MPSFVVNLSSRRQSLNLDKCQNNERNGHEKPKENELKKRISISSNLDEPRIKGTFPHHVQENATSFPFPQTISFDECSGTDDVVITPTYMEFQDPTEGLALEQTLLIQNRGKKMALIKIREPNSMAFDIKPTMEQGFKLCPGLSLSRTVRYFFRRPISVHAMFPIEINGTKLDYHLICTKSAPTIAVSPTKMDFGCVDIGSVSDIKRLVVKSVGGKSARFCIDVGKNEMKINVQPMEGLIKLNEEITLGVQVTGRKEGIFRGEFWIKSFPNIPIVIKVHIIKPRIILRHPTTLNGFTFLNFPPIFWGTQWYFDLPLKNYSSETSSFVAFFEVNNDLISIQENDDKENSDLNVFRIHPVEGRLQPFQEIKLSVTFAPTLKNPNLLQNQHHNKSIEYFIAIIKVKKIQAAEARSILKYKKTKNNNVESHLPEIYINETLCEKDTIDDALSSQEQTQSNVETIYLHGDVEIGRLHFEPNELYLGDLGINDKVLRVINVKNPSKRLPLTFSFISKSCVKCEPREVCVQPGQSVEVLITVTAQLNLDSSFLLEFDLCADSKIKASNKVKSVKIDRAFVYCTYNPLKAAGKIRTTPICKTVSLNKLPLEPDYSLTYTSSEFEMKMNHREFWTQYFRLIFSHTSKDLDAQKIICGCRYFEKTCCSIRIPKTNDTIVQKSFKKFPKLKILENPSTVTSLSPFQIYKIQISPMKLDFGKVAVKTPNHSELTFENKNDFRVEITLISLNEKNVSFPGGNRIFLQPESTKTYAVEFQSSHYGKYSSYINYAINNCLTYQLPIAAEVVTKSLELKTKEITFDNDYHPQEGYRIPFQVIEIQNKINANTKFKWTLSTRTGFTIDPPSGIVAAARRLCVSVYPTALPQHAEATMTVENGARAILKLEAPRQQRVPRVSLLEANMDVGEVPLCLTHRLHAILSNAEYYEVVFEVDDVDLLRGVDVTPLTGHVPPRGVVVLNITLKFDTCMKFSTLINIVVQKRITLQLKLSGTVVFPRLKFEPSIIEMKKISSNSYQIKEILITNLTNAKITIQVLLKQYPEFGLSFSASRNNDYIDDELIIQILPQTTIKLFLHVTPCDLAVYSFYIPLIINEMLGPVLIESDNISPNKFMKRHSHFYSANTGITKLPIPSKIPTIYVHCTVTHPIICFNKLSFKFNDDLQEDEIRIINHSRKEVSFTLITEDVRKTKDCPFIICWMQGGESILVNNFISCLLLPDENALFKVKFQPKKPGHYIFEVPINLGYNQDAQLYNKFKFDGLYATQCIETDVLEVYLVPVPLNVSAREKFTLNVCDFTKVNSIQAKVCHPEKYSGIFQDNTLKVHFPERNNIDSSSMQHEIVVEIELISAVSVSFCTNIIFSDIEKITSLTVTVYGTVDSSLLTIHIYDQKINSNFILMKHQKYLSDLITFIQPSENLQTLVFDSKSCSISSISEISKPEREFRLHSMESCKTVITYKKENASIEETLFNSSYESIKPCKLFYPLFPMSKSSNKQVLFMQKTLKSIEEWLYSNLFHYQFHPNLNEGAIETSLGTKVFQSLSEPNKQENNLKLYSLIDVVEYLSGANEVLEINSRLKNTKYKNNHERIQNTLHAYCKIFQYLMLKGACISYVLPEFFLTYNDFEKLRININYFLPECIFKSHSIYSWLDIVLQSYKCFILNPIDEEMLKKQAVLLNNAKNVDNATYKGSGLKVEDIINQSKKRINIPMCEAILLGWLEYYCNQIFDKRSISNFEDCLSDGLALIAVTIAYCPFLKNDFFYDLYLNPVSREEKTHNGICLISAWKKIRLGFIITPAEIVDPHCVQMLLLIVHLFKNLPTYLPRDKILFSCALTKSITRKIQLSSTPSTPVNYVVQFFGNDNLFSSKLIISTNPSKKQQIRISYHARKIRKEKVYLVLCGSAMGPHFGENQTFLLEGFPDDLEVSGKYTIRSKLYNPTEKNLEIIVPYNYQTQYEIWLSNNQPKLLDKLIITQWKSIQNVKVPTRLWLNEKVLNVVENSQKVNLSISIACMVCDSRSFWIVFQSDVGDFIIQINSICQTTVTDYASIEVLNKECICTNLPAQFLTECPLSKKLAISSRNHQLDNCILHVFKKSLNKEEKVFWDTCIDNIIGLRFIEWFTRNAENSIIEEFKHLFKPFVIYNISKNNDKLLITPLNINVKGNRHFNDKFELTIHLSQISPDLTDLLITLASSDKKEIRVCKIEIFYEKSISNFSHQSLEADNKSQSSFGKSKKL